MPLLCGEDVGPSGSYVCPMHPDVTATEPATCPICGMRLIAAAVSYVCPMHPDVTASEPATAGSAGWRLPAC
jgi:hypothetical protein